MAVHSFKKVQYIPCSLTKAWDFFSSPANLPHLTPKEMDFRIISRFPAARVYAGQLIEYRLRPLPGLRVYWMTEITHVVAPDGSGEPVGMAADAYFVDEQRRGPYSLWHHQHHFKEVAGGIEMADIVHYQLPLGFLGDWVDSLLVKGQLEGIFRYRFQQVETFFGKWTGPTPATETLAV